MKYSEGFRASVVRKTQDGSGRSVYQVAKETGVSPVTIRNWITLFKNGSLGVDGCDALTPSQRSPGEKLALLLESQIIPDDSKGEWLRKHGLHSEHLPLWAPQRSFQRQELVRIMNDKQTDLKAENAQLKKTNKALQKENKRQAKALSELAILISFKKKYPNLFEETEAD